jgi:hypothetical protein
MFNKNPIIICASGNSISDGIGYGLLDFLKGHITIGINHWYSHAFEPTFTSFVDWQFYRDQLDTLEKLGLIIGKYEPQLKNCPNGKGKPTIDLIKANTILLPKHTTFFGQDSWRIWERLCLNCRHKFTDDFRIPRPNKCPKCQRNQIQKFGFYSGHLTGLFALTLAIALGFKDIYLLGYDCCEYKGKTHFYQDKVDLEKLNIANSKIYHGVGVLEHTNGKRAFRTSTYNNPSALNEQWYKPYEQVLQNVNIVNVSPISKINVFPKMDYPNFFKTVGEGQIKQEKIREEIKDLIYEKIKK